MIRNEKLDYEKLILLSDSLNYDNITAQKIIFCEGSAASHNPFFKDLKFKHSKGEILELKIPGFKLNEIVSDAIFVMPIGNDRYKVGATYCWDKLNYDTTDSACKELLDKLRNISSTPFEVLNQKSGIRPTMHDRKPVIGMLPDKPQIGIFNGLGSKGALLGPYLAKQFADYLLGDSTYIHPEAHIERYFKRK